MKILTALLSRWADATPAKRVLDLESELDASKRMLAIARAEVESMAAVIARDRARIKAEGAVYARQQAEAEGVVDERRSRQGVC